jgi:hypothetical protein
VLASNAERQVLPLRDHPELGELLLSGLLVGSPLCDRQGCDHGTSGD